MMATILQYCFGFDKVSKPSGEGYTAKMNPGAFTGTLVLILLMVVLAGWVI